MKAFDSSVDECSLDKLKKRHPGHLIVKSASNIRSQVVGKEEFCQWNQKNLYHLPTLFQERIALESNPGPGWSTFQHASKKYFTKHVLNRLKEVF